MRDELKAFNVDPDTGIFDPERYSKEGRVKIKTTLNYIYQYNRSLVRIHQDLDKLRALDFCHKPEENPYRKQVSFKYEDHVISDSMTHVVTFLNSVAPRKAAYDIETIKTEMKKEFREAQDIMVSQIDILQF